MPGMLWGEQMRGDAYKTKGTAGQSGESPTLCSFWDEKPTANRHKAPLIPHIQKEASLSFKIKITSIKQQWLWVILDILKCSWPLQESMLSGQWCLHPAETFHTVKPAAPQSSYSSATFIPWFHIICAPVQLFPPLYADSFVANI